MILQPHCDRELAQGLFHILEGCRGRGEDLAIVVEYAIDLMWEEELLSHEQGEQLGGFCLAGKIASRRRPAEAQQPRINVTHQCENSIRVDGGNGTGLNRFQSEGARKISRKTLSIWKLELETDGGREIARGQASVFLQLVVDGDPQPARDHFRALAPADEVRLLLVPQPRDV